MQSVGQQLRAARRRLGVSLEEISAQTRITIKVLQAIENDEPAKLGSPFFYRSFVRQFAENVQLPYSDLASAVQAAADTIPEPAIPGQGQPTGYSPKLAPLRARRSKTRWLQPFGSLIVMLVACSTFYAMWQNSRSRWENSLGLSMRRVVKSLSNVSRNAPPAPAPLPAELSQAPEAPADSAFRIELSAIEPTWLSIFADGKRAFRGILRTTQTEVFEGHEIARIHTGNAGGVSVVFNGKAIGRLGLRGQVLTAVFTKDHYQIVEPSTHIALLRVTLNAE